jgi:hypothetical protein
VLHGDSSGLSDCYACGSGAVRLLLPCAYMRLLRNMRSAAAQHGLFGCIRVTLAHAVSLWYSGYAMLKRHQLPPARCRLDVCLAGCPPFWHGMYVLEGEVY